MANPDDIDFQFLAEHSVDMICRIGLDDAKLRYVSPACFRILGWTPEEMVGTGPEEFVLAEDLPLVAKAIERDRTPGAEGSTATIRMRRRDGSAAWMEVKARVVRDAVTGAAWEAVVVMRDVTERKLLEEILISQAFTDGLTGLVNRRGFDQELEKEWKRTLRQGTQVSLLLLDIDYFKQFNDRYGHQLGDDCLRTVAVSVKNAIRREIDTVARYGGEEIAVILPCTDAAGALTVAENVRRAVAALHIPHADNQDAGGHVTVSVGAATALARHGGTMKMPESLLLSADHALYKAKREGRNQIASALLMASQDR
jgi:diguanylate cyclase (GGDEF)-like protein/PAS domain S-box-containing protein